METLNEGTSGTEAMKGSAKRCSGVLSLYRGHRGNFKQRVRKSNLNLLKTTELQYWKSYQEEVDRCKRN